ncbi:MAG: SRPBCC family protein [Deltaproteobacteria bacterium]|nr:SRPBCC family protein [Deltaproteobacteria bacterium]
MGEQRIKITQLFNSPVDTIFSLLTDHEAFGNVINAKIKRVVDSQTENKNGLGSVRRINPFPVPAFEETVVTFEPNQLMEYVISKGSPIKNHKGRMEFSDEQGKTRLNYTIDFEPKLPFLFFGSILKKAIEKPIREGLKRLADRYDIQK